VRTLARIGLVAAVLFALAVGVARGWSQMYVNVAVFAPAQTAASSFNASLSENYIQWDNRYGGYPSVGLRYCASNGSCYSWVWSQSPGVFYDHRTISYGLGECHAYGGNNYNVWVSGCRVSNG